MEHYIEDALAGLERNYQSVSNWTVFDRGGDGSYMWLGTVTKKMDDCIMLDDGGEMTFEVIDISTVSSVMKTAPAAVIRVNPNFVMAYVPNVNWGKLAVDIVA